MTQGKPREPDVLPPCGHGREMATMRVAVRDNQSIVYCIRHGCPEYRRAYVD
jgi:hypothetical protein